MKMRTDEILLVTRKEAVVELLELMVNHSDWDYSEALFKVACMDDKTIDAYLDDYQSGSGTVWNIN